VPCVTVSLGTSHRYGCIVGVTHLWSSHMGLILCCRFSLSTSTVWDRLLSSTWKKKQVLWFRLWTCTNHSVHRKPTQSGCYFNYSSNHPLHVKRRVIHSLCIRATIIWQEEQGLTEEMDSVNRDLQLSNFPVRSSTQLTALPWKWVIQKVRECHLHWCIPHEKRVWGVETDCRLM
jgi:hypothetical protein